MGVKSSKKLNVSHLEGQQAIERQENVDIRKKANPSKKGKKRNTYLPYPKFSKVAEKKNPPKTDVGVKPETVEPEANPTDVRDDPDVIEPDTNSTGANSSKQCKKRKPCLGQKFPIPPDEIEPLKTGEAENNHSKAVEDESTFKEDVPNVGDDLPYETVDPGSGRTDAGRESPHLTAYENVEFSRDCCGAQGSSVFTGHLEAESEMSIRRYYRELKRRISVKDVCDHLIQNDVLVQEDIEDIGSDKQLESADRLLQIIMRKNQSAYEAFLNALRCTGFQDLADELQQPVATMKERPYTRKWNEMIILKVWPKIEDFLIKELLPKYIIDFFMQENILSVDEYEVIFQCMGKRLEMAKKLVEKIQQKLPRSLFVLVYALEETGKGKENGIVQQLERIISDESNLENVPESDREEEMFIDVKDKIVKEDACTVKVPLSRDGHATLKLTLEKDGHSVDATELEINTFINTADGAIKLQVSLKPTDCKIIKSEHGCVIVHLWPQSRDAYQKLSEFCKKGQMAKLVLDLLREKDIVSSVPEGELCIDIKVSYHEEDQEIEEAGEPQTDLIQLIKDNRSFLREEIEVQTLIGEVLENKTLKKMFSDQEITELKRFLAKDKLEAADYFLKCLLDRDPKRRQSCIDKLKRKTKTNIFENLLNLGSMYRNSQGIKENILHHYELVVDEIDPSQFEDTFMDREILDKKFFEDLGGTQLRRRARAVSFLKEVLDKGGRALFALVDVLREMGCEELVEKLTSFDKKSLKSKQQRKVRVCNDDRKDYVNVEVVNATTPEVLMWSCCMTVIVTKKHKDDKNADISDVSSTDKEPIYENWRNEQPTYANVSKNETDEGICDTEDVGSVFRRSKTEIRQIERSVTQPEPPFGHESDEKSGKVLTFPLARVTERGKQFQRTQLNFAAKCKDDSAIDLSL